MATLGYFCGVYYTCCKQVLILFCTGIETVIACSLFNSLNHNAAFEPAIVNYLAQGFFNCAFYNGNAGAFIFVFAFQLFQRLAGPDVCYTATGHYTLFHCSAGGMQCIVYPVFSFSFISTSVAAPTYNTATPPVSLASRSCSFSLS